MAVGSERRRFTRIASGQRCWCEAGEVTLYAQMQNLSEGGLFIRTFAPLDMGTNARLRFAFGGEGDEVEADAVVVWSREPVNGAAPGMGLMFVSIDPAVQNRIRDYVAHETAPDSEAAV